MKILIITIALIILAPTYAQEGVCDVNTIHANLTEQLSAIAVDADFWSNLRALRNAMSSFDNICNSMAFNSDEEGIIAVIAPTLIPDGYYTATLTTDGLAFVNITTLQGTCQIGTSRTSSRLFTVSRDDASAGAEALFGAVGCYMIIAVDAREPWTLEFTPMMP